MNTFNTLVLRHPRLFPSILAVLCSCATLGHAQLFPNLQSLSQALPVGSGATDPATGKRLDGPRWVCTADFDLDGHQDFATCHLNGEITVAWGYGNGTFDIPMTLASGTSDLRAIISGDFNGDSRPDLAAAAPYDGVVSLLFSKSPRGFESPLLLPTFKRARNLESGDFDGDGVLDLAVAGPDEWLNPDDPDDTNQVVTGVMHLRGTGGGDFELKGTVPGLGVPHLEDSKLKPVYSLESFRRPGESQDTLAVTHEQSAAVWLLRIGVDGALEISETLSWFGNNQQVESASPYFVDSLKIGTVFSPAATGNMDLVAVMQQM